MTHNRRTFLRAIGANGIGLSAGALFSGTAAAATVITMEGGGADIWSTEDAFHYYYGRADGDFDVVVRNTGVEDTDSWAKGGLMVRESTAADSRNVMLRRRPNGEASLQWRLEDGADSDSGDVTVEGGWLRLTRSGDSVEAFAAADEPDGEGDWTSLGSVEIDLSANALLGLAVTSHDEGTRCTAGFRNLSRISPTTGEDVGDVEVAGDVSVEEGVPLASTDEVTDVTATSATLHGELSDLGGADAAEAYFEYREVPTDSWTATRSETLTEPGSYSVDIDTLTTRRYYEVRAVVDTDDGDTVRGSIVQFSTDGQSNGRSNTDAGPESHSHFEPGDGFAEAAPWLDDETPIITITEPTREQLDRAAKIHGERLVVFETSGTIDLGARTLEIPYDECYIAGQTAPSPGITLIRGGLYVEADDCVVQHVRVRAGDAGKESDWEPDAIHTGDDTKNNVVDHCTATWGIDENLSVGYDTTDTTVSNCLIAEGLNDATHTKGEHGYGSLVGDGADTVALLGNVWANNVERNPLMKYDTRNVLVNNVAAYFDQLLMLRTTYTSLVGNHYLNPRFPDDPIIGRDGYAYLEDNYADGTGPLVDDDITELEDPPLWPEGLEPLPAEEAIEHALSNAGARPADRTEHDRRIIEQVRTDDGSYVDSQEEVGGYPDLEENAHELHVPESGTRAWLRSRARRVETGRSRGPGPAPSRSKPADRK